MRRLAVLLLVAGLSLLGLSAFQYVERVRHQAIEQRELEAALLSARSAAQAEPVERGETRAENARRRAAERASWGRLEIPRVGLSVILDEGTDGPTLRRAVGHLEGTPFPGEPGNVVLAGHRDSLFRPLEGVRAGDRMRVTTLDGTFDYEVSSVVIVPPDRTDLLAPAPNGEREVTLVTCYPFYYVGPAPLRYIVRGIQLDESSRTKGEEPSGLPAGDPSPRPGRALQ